MLALFDARVASSQVRVAGFSDVSALARVTLLVQWLNKLINGPHGEKIRFLLAGGLNTVVGYTLFALGLWVLTPVFELLYPSNYWLLDFNYWQCGSTTPDTIEIWCLTFLVWASEHSYLIIQWITWAISVPFGAFTLKYFAFRAEGSYLRQALRSYLVYLPTQIVASLFLTLFSLVLGLHPLLGQLFTIFIVTIISYLGHKYFTFKQA